ncbi:MAG: hypothetical protein GXP43_02045, partial [bacterium]|nr:hypothetical protein [bacterium]
NAILAIVALGILYMAPAAAETAENLIKGQLNVNFGESLGGAFHQTISPVSRIHNWQQRRAQEKRLISLDQKLQKVQKG